MKFPANATPVIQGAYILENTNLRLRYASALGTATAEIRARILRPDGSIVENNFSITIDSDRTIKTEFRDLTDGILLSVAFFVSNVDAPLDIIYAQLALVKGQLSAQVPYAILFQDYIFGEYSLAWPPGTIRSPHDGPGYLTSVETSNPSAGDGSVALDLDGNTRFQIQSLSFQLVTDSNVANRNVRVDITSSTGYDGHYLARFSQVADETIVYTYGSGLAPQINTTDRGRMMVDLPINAYYDDSFTITINVANVQVGDQLSNIILSTRQWLNFDT